MKKNNSTINLAAKVIGGTLFLAVFLFNVNSFVKKDANGFSFAALKAYAQSGGSASEEESSGTYAKQDVVDTTHTQTTQGSDGKPCVQKKTCTKINCTGTGNVQCTPMPEICSGWGPCNA